VTLASNEGWLSWESAAPAADAKEAAFVFTAEVGGGGAAAELSVDGAPAAGRVCLRPVGAGDHPLRQYVLSGIAARAGRPLRFEARFRTGMRDESAYFALAREQGGLDRAALGPCAPPPGVERVAGVGRILDASHNNYPADTGRWTVAQVF
jgi:hypothetical protein